jgi:hypothetical protein
MNTTECQDFLIFRFQLYMIFLSYTVTWNIRNSRNYLGFDWWKHFLKILRRSEVTINLTRPLKKNASKWVLPLVVLYCEKKMMSFQNLPWQRQNKPLSSYLTTVVLFQLLQICFSWQILTLNCIYEDYIILFLVDSLRSLRV